MSSTMPAQSSETKPSLERSGIRRSVQVLVSVLIIGVLLFLSAGRLDWLWAWLFLAIWLLLMLMSAFVMRKVEVDPFVKTTNRPKWVQLYC